MISSRRIYSRHNGPSSLDYMDNEQAYRKKSLSRSFYELRNADDDTWFRDDLLYKDHLQEVLSKWHNIDDGIWGKIICLERNRRVAKAYARAPSLTINASEACFDGYTIGLGGFDNPYRDEYTESVLASIGTGLAVKIDGEGNIWAKRRCRCAIYVPEWRRSLRDTHSTSIGRELEAARGRLPSNKSCKIFDMERFHENMAKEMRSTYPNTRSLELQCISSISFASDCPNILESPASILLVNIVALDMLKSRLGPSASKIGLKPDLRGHFKSVAGSVWASVRKLASRSSRNSMSSLFDFPRHWRGNNNSKEKEENPYSSLTSTLSCNEETWYSDGLYGSAIREEEMLRPRMNDFASRSFNRMKSSTIDNRFPKPEPMPDYDATSSSSMSSSIYKANHDDDDDYDDWTSTPANKPSFYPQSKLNGPLNSVFRVLPVDAPIVDPIRITTPDQQVDPSNSCDSSTNSSSNISPSPESTDEAESHIYSSISDSKDGKASMNQVTIESVDEIKGE